MASLTPARIAGRDRDLGSLEPGKRADVLVLDRDLQVQRVFIDGIEIQVSLGQHSTIESNTSPTRKRGNEGRGACRIVNGRGDPSALPAQNALALTSLKRHNDGRVLNTLARRRQQNGRVRVDWLTPEAVLRMTSTITRSSHKSILGILAIGALAGSPTPADEPKGAAEGRFQPADPADPLGQVLQLPRPRPQATARPGCGSTPRKGRLRRDRRAASARSCRATSTRASCSTGSPPRTRSSGCRRSRWAGRSRPRRSTSSSVGSHEGAEWKDHWSFLPPEQRRPSGGRPRPAPSQPDRSLRPRPA